MHEALIRNWPTLASWINRDRAFLSWLRQIKPNSELWLADPADDGPLLRGGMLAQASDWFTRRFDDLSPARGGLISRQALLCVSARRRQERRRDRRRSGASGNWRKRLTN